MPHSATALDQHVGRVLRERRRAAGYSQAALGAAIGVTYQQVQKYEKGKNRIAATTLYRTASVLGCDIGSFFEGVQGAADLPAD